MNIFVLDSDIDKCAQYHSDKHVIKMILESTQMLCTVLWKNGVEAPYRPTHHNHPCTLWAGESLSNWRWLRSLALALNNEYRHRYKTTRNHASALVAQALPEPPIRDLGLTPFAQAMPEHYRIEGNAVEAYRTFYNHEKSTISTWTNRPVPDWTNNK